MKSVVEQLTHKFPKYSDYNFYSMMTYNVNGHTEVSLLNRNLTVKFEDYISSKPFYSFLGTNEIESTIDSLLALSKSNNLDPAIKLIPEVVIEAMNSDTKSRYIVEEDEDNNDYIYSLAEHVALSGHAYHTVRPDIGHFKKLYQNVEARVMNPQDLHGKCLDVFRVWKERKDESNKTTDGVEYVAFERALNYSPYFDIFSTGLYDNTNLISVTLIDITSGYPTGAFIKADTNYKGILKYAQYSAEKLLFENGYTEINCEQDLGIPGLRQAKRSWNPVRYLKKYTIKQR